MGILLGLVTALTWGGADFVARFSTHRIGTLRTMFYMQFTGFLLLTVSMRWFGGWGHLATVRDGRRGAGGCLAAFFTPVPRFPFIASFEFGRLAVFALSPAVLPPF